MTPNCVSLDTQDSTLTMSSSTTEGRDISYDVVIQVIEWLSGDYFSLHSCSLVNRKFRDASGTLLYRNVTYSPEYNPVVNLRERDELSVDDSLVSHHPPP